MEYRTRSQKKIKNLENYVTELDFSIFRDF